MAMCGWGSPTSSDDRPGLRDDRVVSELKAKPIVIGESDPDGCAACQGPQLGYRNGTMYSSYTAACSRGSTTRRAARREPRGRADVGVRVRGSAVLRRLPRARENGIDLPVLNVFRMFSKMGGQRVASRARRGRARRDHQRAACAAARTSPRSPAATATTLAILVWHYHDDDVAGPDADVDARRGGTAGRTVDAADALPHRRDALQRVRRRGSGWVAHRAERQAVSGAASKRRSAGEDGCCRRRSTSSAARRRVVSRCRDRACRCSCSNGSS